MKFKLGPNFTTITGSSKNSQLSYVTHKGKVYARARTTPANPRTPDQQRSRAILGKTTNHWKTLTAEQRNLWEKYAQAQHSCGQPQFESGYAACRLANTYRCLLKLPLVSDAPTAPPPIAPFEVTVLSDEFADALRLRVTHPYPDTDDLVLFARVTPATASPARRPRLKDLRAVRGLGPDSAVALPPSGGEAVFGPTRFLIEPAQRFGLELRIVRVSDGMPSAPTFRDLVMP